MLYKVNSPYFSRRSIQPPPRKKKNQISPIGQQLYDDAVAIWEFKSSSGTIGTDRKGDYSASSFANVVKTNNNLFQDETTLKRAESGDGHVIIPYSAQFNHQGKSFTYACLFFPTTLQSGYNNWFLFGKDLFQSGHRTISLALNGVPNDFYTIRFLLGNGTNFNEVIFNITSNELNSWNLAICEYYYDSNNMANCKQRLYVNNTLIAESTPSFFIGEANTSNFCLANTIINNGGQVDLTYGTRSHQIGYIARWDKTLNTEEKDYLNNNGNFRFII